MAGIADLIGAQPNPKSEFYSKWLETRRRMSQLAYQYLMDRDKPNLGTAAGHAAYNTILTTLKTYGTLTDVI